MNIKRLVTTSYQENCYIIWDDDKKSAIIDPGGDNEKIAAFIEKNDLKIEKILLTHGHFDHIGAAAELSEKYDVPVVLNEKEMVIVNERGESFGILFDVPKKREYIKENDEVIIGNISLKVIETPGHTVGSVCYIYDNTMFSGDTLFLNTVGRWDFYTGSLEMLYDSVVNKLFKMEDSIKVYPGHGFSTTIAQEKINNGILGYRI